ncbi:hypothetical protein HMPREF1210_01589 [Paenisporosarcina sp. HGH0030]|uniref:S-layer homology domain-containing protein n=1 Tax=Paenisporosarcina sp. HGH0030 TaxID=1078085 RepID=UPI00034E2EB9|nr:S-layer homology domain-containing protein [Paenisporosarcina sp. HGH0030]EPD52236.1 hypothetical protein HMPREF1210_01589 [Paenisporosarcina sp. HGH0030]
MTKFSSDNKTIKAIIAGAVAFTPVIAVGINAEKASAAEQDSLPSNVETFLNQLDVVYADPSLTKDDLSKLHAAQNYLAAKSDWVDVAERMLNKSTLTAEEQKVLTYLLPLFAASTTTNLKASINSFYSKVSDAELQKAFDVQVGSTTFTKATFTSFLVETETKVFTNYANNTKGTTLFNEFVNALISPTSYPDVKKAITDKFILTRVFDELQDILSVGIINDAKPAFAKVATIYDGKFGVDTGNPGGGTPGPTPPPVEVNKDEVSTGGSTIESNPQSVIDAITKAATVEALVVKLDAGVEVVSIPATILSALKNKNGEAVVVIASGDATYEVPVSQIDLLAAAASLGVASAELKLVVTVDEVANPLAGKAGFKTLSDAIDFKLSLVAPDNKTIELKNFSKPVQRSISTSTTLNPLTTVGVVVNADGSVVAVPTFVEDKGANLYRNSNSVYTLIENFKTFNDVNNGKNWSEEYVEKLASRMVVKGTTATTFSPNREITRGEFAAILSRGLGLISKSSDVKFTDVSSKQAFNLNGEIAAVVEAGIVKGDAKGKFRPYDEISRDEAAIMISRALDFIGTDGVKVDTTKKITDFTDYRYIGNTARPHVQKVYQAGYINGYSNGTFGPSQDTERGQMAKILYNFLQSVKFIN